MRPRYNASRASAVAPAVERRRSTRTGRLRPPDSLADRKIGELIHHLKMNCTMLIVAHDLRQTARVSDITTFFCTGNPIEVDAGEMSSPPEFRQTEQLIAGRLGSEELD